MLLLLCATVPPSQSGSVGELDDMGSSHAEALSARAVWVSCAWVRAAVHILWVLCAVPRSGLMQLRSRVISDGTGGGRGVWQPRFARLLMRQRYWIPCCEGGRACVFVT